MSPQTRHLEKVVSRYEKSLRDLKAIEQELRMLPGSEAIEQSLQLNDSTRTSVERALAVARRRLEAERVTDAQRVSRDTRAA